MKYKCIYGFTVPKCDDDGFETDKEFIVEENSIWKLSNSNSRIVGGENRLDSDKYGWLEISNDLFKKCFKPVEDGVSDA